MRLTLSPSNLKQPNEERIFQPEFRFYRVLHNSQIERNNNSSKQGKHSERLGSPGTQQLRYGNLSLTEPTQTSAHQPDNQQRSHTLLTQFADTTFIQKRTKRLAQSIHLNNSFNIFLAVVFTLLVIASICIWVSIRLQRRKPRSRRASSNAKAVKSSRAQVAQFYANSTKLSSQSNSVKLPVLSNLQCTRKMIDTCASRPTSLHYSSVHRHGSFSHAPGVRLSLGGPPAPTFSIGTPQRVQPGSCGSILCETGHSVRMSRGSSSLIQRRNTTTGELLRTLLTKPKYPILSQQSPSSDPGRLIFGETCPIAERESTPVDMRDAVWSRSSLIRRPTRFSCGEESTAGQLKQLNSTFGRHSLGDSEDPTWTQLGSSLYGSGRISFSLSYVCTTGMLVVTVNQLNGVHLITTSGHLLPSQMETAFQVTVRLQAPSQSTASSDGFLVKCATHFVVSTLNPIFDQSFSFKLAMNEIEAAQLVFIVYRTTLEPLSSQQFALQRRSSQTSLRGTLSKSPLTREQSRSGETVCLGSARYQLCRDDLVNRPDILREVWREIHREVDSDEEHLTELPGIEQKNGSLKRNCLVQKEAPVDANTAAEHKNVSTTKRTGMLRAPVGQSKRTSIEISTYYERNTSQLVILLKEVQNLHLQPKDTYIFVRTVMYKGDKILATARSALVKTGVSTLCDWKRSGATGRHHSGPNTTDHLFSLEERAKFPIDINRLVESSTLGVIIFLCSRSRFGQSRLIGQCSIGASGFTEGEGAQFWTELLNGVRQMSAKEDQTRTAIFTSWQSVCSSLVCG